MKKPPPSFSPPPKIRPSPILLFPSFSSSPSLSSLTPIHPTSLLSCASGKETPKRSAGAFSGALSGTQFELAFGDRRRKFSVATPHPQRQTGFWCRSMMMESAAPLRVFTCSLQQHCIGGRQHLGETLDWSYGLTRLAGAAVCPADGTPSPPPLSPSQPRLSLVASKKADRQTDRPLRGRTRL